MQEGEFERVGDNNTKKVDTRIVAATNRDLLEEIEAGRFREDLYYRLNVVPIYLPPLRERREDVEPLVLFFLNRYGEQNRREMRQGPPRGHAAAPRARLAGQRPRAAELRRASGDPGHGSGAAGRAPAAPTSRRAGLPRPIRHRGGGADFGALTVELVRQGIRAAGPAANDLHDRIVGQVERELIQQVLQTCDRVQIKAAARLGINRNTLHKKLSEFRIDESGPGPGGFPRNGEGGGEGSGDPGEGSLPDDD